LCQEICIRTQTESVNDVREPLIEQVSSVAKSANKSIRKRFFRSKKRAIRYSLVIVNVALFIGVASFIVANRPNSSNAPAPTLLSTKLSKDLTDPLDVISGADIAVNIAQLTSLDEKIAVTNNADSVNTQLDTVPSDTQVVSKPQIVKTELKSIQDVTSYTTVEGDTVTSVARQFGVTTNSIKWSNSLTEESLSAGRTLSIPPIDGFVYEVKEEDTAQSLAARYNTTEAKIVAFNDIELTGLVTGQKIMIPDGKIPAPVQRSYAPSFRVANYGYNGYDYGYCTFYVANRISVPTNWGNAKWWDDNASRTPGWGVIYSPGVGEVPAGAIMVSNRGYYGHVAYVESVNADGSINISEMNTRGWNVTSTQTLTPDRIGAYNYVVRY
jgi:surface antigen